MRVTRQVKLSPGDGRYKAPRNLGGWQARTNEVTDRVPRLRHFSMLRIPIIFEPDKRTIHLPFSD